MSRRFINLTINKRLRKRLLRVQILAMAKRRAKPGSTSLYYREVRERHRSSSF